MGGGVKVNRVGVEVFKKIIQRGGQNIRGKSN